MKKIDISSFDPYELKQSLIDLAESYFQTGKLDTYEAGFLGYMIQSLAQLTSDVLFMNGLAYNEAFTTKAMLDTSLVNLAQMFDYQYRKTIPASGILTLEIPLDNTGFEFTIPQYSKVSAGSIPYKVKNKYNVYVNSLSDIKIYSIDTNNFLKTVPFDLYNDGTRNILKFDVDIFQAEFYSYNFVFPKTQLYKFHHETIKDLDGNVFMLVVLVNGIPYKVIDNIYSAGINENVVSMRPFENAVELIFGNGVFGHLPDDGDECNVLVGVTQGTKGHIMARTAKLVERIMDSNGKAVIINSYNPYPIINAVDMETQDQMKRNIIKHISSLDRLVSKDDYFSLNNIVPYFRNTIAKSFLLRRDVHINEIVTYMVFFDEDNEPIPTNTITMEIPDSTDVIPKNHVFNVDGTDYICPYRIILNDASKIKAIQYEYIVDDFLDSPSLIQSFRGELIGLNNLEFIYNGSDNIIVRFHGTCGDTIDPLDISGTISIGGNDYDFYIDPISDIDNVVMTTNSIPIDTLPQGVVEYEFMLKWQADNHSQYKSNIILRQTLDEIVWSNYLLDSGNKRVYGIPVILKEYYDNNTSFVDMNVLSNIALYRTEMVKYHMMTDVVNIKFAKTYGTSINMRLNDYNTNALYTYDSTFSIPIPLKINVDIVLDDTNSKTYQEITNEVKNVIFIFIQVKSDFHMDLFRSELERYIHDTIEEVSYVEITYPDKEIVYSFTLDMIPSTDREVLLSFVPEYIWIDRDNIFVNIKQLSM